MTHRTISTREPFFCRWFGHAYQFAALLWASPAHTVCLERCRRCGAEREFDQKDYH